MTKLVPTSANEFIEHQLKERLDALERVFKADALSIVGDLISPVDDHIRTVVEEMRQQMEPYPRLVVILTTYGGVIETVHRIVDTLRHHYSHVSFIIPNYAFSAGTVLAMSGDQIYMDYYSRLGPIDPQVLNTKGAMVPALGYLKRWESLLEKAQNSMLSLPEMQLMIDGFDQAELYQYEQARELSISLLKEWLVKYKFKDWTTTETRGLPVDDDLRMERAESIARELSNTDRWHSHGYGISKDVLQRNLNLRIDDLDQDNDKCEKVRQYSTLLADYMLRRGHRFVIHTLETFFSLPE